MVSILLLVSRPLLLTLLRIEPKSMTDSSRDVSSAWLLIAVEPRGSASNAPSPIR